MHLLALKKDFKFRMLKYLFLSIVAIGIIGNSINIVIYSRNKIRKVLTFRFLLCLSITDLVILLFCGIETGIEYKFDINLRNISSVACKFGSFLVYFLTQSRNFLSMAITLESKNYFLKILNSIKLSMLCSSIFW